MKDALMNLLVESLKTTGPLITMLIAALITAGIRYLQSKTNNDKAKSALDRLDDVLINAVKEVQQAVVPTLDTKDPNWGAKAKQAALDSAKSHLGPKGINELMTVLGWGDDATVTANISRRLEAHVHDLKLIRTQVESETVKSSPYPTTDK